MFKLLLITCLTLSVFAYDNCFVNIGNVISPNDPFFMDNNSQSTLSDCKSLCDIWDSYCETIEYDATTGSDPCSYSCDNGDVTEEGCNLYEGEIAWEVPTNDEDRFQAFELCEPSCWELENGYECYDEDVFIDQYDGELSYADCKAECLQHNIDNEGGEILCGGVEITSDACILTQRCTTTISDNDGDKYYKFVCLEEYEADTVVEDEEEGAVEVAEEDESNVVVTDGETSCSYTELFSECDYQGESMVVALIAEELDWEPKSWCIPEYQTLTLHNAYDLEGDSVSYSSTVSCHDNDLIYSSFLQINTQAKKSNKKYRVSVQ